MLYLQAAHEDQKIASLQENEELMKEQEKILL